MEQKIYKGKGGTIFGQGGVQSYSQDEVPLSPKQTEILNLMNQEGLTPKQIADRRQTTVWAVYKAIRKIKGKGYKRGGTKGGVQFFGIGQNIVPPTNKGQHPIRLHGQKFTAKVLYAQPRYHILRRKKSHIDFLGCTVTLHRGSVKVLATPGVHFYGRTPLEAYSHSIKFFNTLFNKLESKLGIMLIKGMNTCIKEYQAHYSEVNNELSKEVEHKGQRFNIYAKEDGKLWFTIDNSFNFHEAECLHPDTGLEDMEKIKPIFDYYRSDSALTPLDVQNAITGLVRGLQSQSGMMGEYAETIKAHIGSIKKLGKGVDEMTEQVSLMNQVLYSISELIQNGHKS